MPLCLCEWVWIIHVQVYPEARTSMRPYKGRIIGSRESLATGIWNRTWVLWKKWLSLSHLSSSLNWLLNFYFLLMVSEFATESLERLILNCMGLSQWFHHYSLSTNIKFTDTTSWKNSNRTYVWSLHSTSKCVHPKNWKTRSQKELYALISSNIICISQEVETIQACFYE